MFCIDKHGQLGIWDAQAPPTEVTDADGEPISADEREGGHYFRLQPHWPATSKSSISSIKVCPSASHIAYTTSYDMTVRALDFEKGLSTEVYTMPEEWGAGALICGVDLSADGREMWVADALGGISHLDLREEVNKKGRKGRWFGVSEQKVGSVSLNPRDGKYIVTASNSRQMRIWDVRKLSAVGVGLSIALLMFQGMLIGMSCRRRAW